MVSYIKIYFPKTGCVYHGIRYVCIIQTSFRADKELFLKYAHLNNKVKPGFHMIVTVGDASPRQARGHIGDGCVKWEHFLNDVANVADQTGTVRGRMERVEMSLKRGCHMIITVIVSICRRLIGDTSPKRRRLLRSYGNQAQEFEPVLKCPGNYNNLGYKIFC